MSYILYPEGLLNSFTFILGFTKLFGLFSEIHKLLTVLIELVENLSSKVDVQTLNMQRVITNLMPEEEVIVTPANLPPLPLKDEKAFDAFEEFLTDEVSFTRMVC